MRVVVTAHAVERYRDRVRPALDLPDARRELETLIDRVGEFGVQPDWHTHRDVRVDRWLWLGGDVVLPCVAGRAVTCLDRRSRAPEYVEARRRHRRRRRHVHRTPPLDPAGARRARKARRVRERVPGAEAA